MSFGIDKCCVPSLHRGRLVESHNAILPSGDSICSLRTEESYRYLGILESDSIKHQTMKQQNIDIGLGKYFQLSYMETILYKLLILLQSLCCAILRGLSIGLSRNCINWMLELES